MSRQERVELPDNRQGTEDDSFSVRNKPEESEPEQKERRCNWLTKKKKLYF
jgi:hypothetical protein